MNVNLHLIPVLACLLTVVSLGTVRTIIKSTKKGKKAVQEGTSHHASMIILLCNFVSLCLSIEVGFLHPMVQQGQMIMMIALAN